MPPPVPSAGPPPHAALEACSRVSTLSESWLQLKLQWHVELEVEVVVVVEGAVCLE